MLVHTNKPKACAISLCEGILYVRALPVPKLDTPACTGTTAS